METTTGVTDSSCFLCLKPGRKPQIINLDSGSEDEDEENLHNFCLKRIFNYLEVDVKVKHVPEDGGEKGEELQEGFSVLLCQQCILRAGKFNRFCKELENLLRKIDGSVMAFSEVINFKLGSDKGEECEEKEEDRGDQIRRMAKAKCLAMLQRQKSKLPQPQVIPDNLKKRKLTLSTSTAPRRQQEVPPAKKIITGYDQEEGFTIVELPPWSPPPPSPSPSPPPTSPGNSPRRTSAIKKDKLRCPDCSTILVTTRALTFHQKYYCSYLRNGNGPQSTVTSPSTLDVSLQAPDFEDPEDSNNDFLRDPLGESPPKRKSKPKSATPSKKVSPKPRKSPMKITTHSQAVNDDSDSDEVFYCPFCKEPFPNEDLLSHHLLLNHCRRYKSQTGVRRYPCKDCGIKSFFTEEMLAKHKFNSCDKLKDPDVNEQRLKEYFDLKKKLGMSNTRVSTPPVDKIPTPVPRMSSSSRGAVRRPVSRRGGGSCRGGSGFSGSGNRQLVVVKRVNLDFSKDSVTNPTRLISKQKNWEESEDKPIDAMEDEEDVILLD